MISRRRHLLKRFVSCPQKFVKDGLLQRLVLISSLTCFSMPNKTIWRNNSLAFGISMMKKGCELSKILGAPKRHLCGIRLIRKGNRKTLRKVDYMRFCTPLAKLHWRKRRRPVILPKTNLYFLCLPAITTTNGSGPQFPDKELVLKPKKRKASSFLYLGFKFLVTEPITTNLALFSS